MRRKGFTIIELLAVAAIMSIILLVGVSVMKMMTATLYDGQIESQGRINLMDNIYYMTREIQSAEFIQVSSNCKSMKIKQRGDSDYNIVYTITDGVPCGNLNFQSKSMLYLDYNQSKFEVCENKVKVTLAVYKTNLDYQAKPQLVVFEVSPRNDKVNLEVAE